MRFVFHDDELAGIAKRWLFERLLHNGVVSVADFCDYAGFTRSVEDKFRVWKNPIVVNTCSEENGARCVLYLPEPEHIKNITRNTEVEKDTSEDQMVSHPPHYQAKNGMEVIDVIEAFTAGLEGIEATDTGNILKYICRWKSKNGLQDLEKAQWYLTHLIKHVKENTK